MRRPRIAAPRTWKRVTPEPVLDCNRAPCTDLNRLIERDGIMSTCRLLNVHEKTLWRWVTGRGNIPGHQHLAIRCALGELPGTEGQWSGWFFKGGKLWSPENEGYTAGQLRASFYDQDRINTLQRQVQALQVKLAISEAALDRFAPAANERKRA